MTSTCEYVARADAEKKSILQSQWLSANSSQAVTCPCGLKRALTHSFRCLYCGVWFCAPCAELHFGTSVVDWVAKKRVEGRREAERSLFFGDGEGI